MMEKHAAFSDSQFEQQFESGRLDPTLFSHEAHLRLAWIHIRRYGVEQAIRNLTVQIRGFAEGLGAHDKYNETVTIAAIRAVYHFMLKGTWSEFADFMAANSRLKTHFRELLSQHYSTDIFTSEKARRTYLKPELLPFD